MRKYIRTSLCPSRDEVAELAGCYDESLPPPQYDLPREVIDGLIHVRNYLYRLASKIGDDRFDGAGSRDGVGIDCENFGDQLHWLLEACGHDKERYPSWLPDECKEYDRGS